MSVISLPGHALRRNLGNFFFITSMYKGANIQCLWVFFCRRCHCYKWRMEEKCPKTYLQWHLLIFVWSIENIVRHRARFLLLNQHSRQMLHVNALAFAYISFTEIRSNENDVKEKRRKLHWTHTNEDGGSVLHMINIDSFHRFRINYLLEYVCIWRRTKNIRFNSYGATDKDREGKQNTTERELEKWRKNESNCWKCVTV